MDFPSSHQPGDPRRVLKSAASTGDLPAKELLWGCKDSQESIRMARILVEGGFLAITLSEEGLRRFALPKSFANIRLPYFVDNFIRGALTNAPMLWGHFLFELEERPGEALRFETDCTNYLYFRMNNPDKKDVRVKNYGFLAEHEIEEVRSRLEFLSENHPKYSSSINRMIKTLDK
ncbi:MAG: hypothetical protein U5L10_05240 [Candidatus Moranbacteria bacterium]|nr:hypothetical protein [Candidatus Moranbacteria bacterium]